MKSRVQELIQIGDKLFSDRFPLLTLYQSWAENFYPIRADFTRKRWISEEFASYLMSGRPVLAHRELSNQLSAILRPQNMPWFKPQTTDESVNNDRASASWLEMTGDVMRRVFNDRRSQFQRATKEGDADYVLTGQCVIEPSRNSLRDGMFYRTWHIRDCVWTENAELQLDSFHRKWALQARQLLRFAKRNNWSVHPELEKLAEKDPLSEVKCRVITLPSDEYDSFGTDDENGKRRRSASLPFVKIVVDEDRQFLMEETPQRKLGYIVPRWVTIGGFSQYAYSPTAVVALPDGRMLQQMTLTLLEIGSKIVDPPLKAVGDAIAGGVNLYSGAITWVDPDYDERTGSALEAIEFHPEGLEWGVEREKQIEQVINEAFYLNVLNLPQFEGEGMTAYEVQQRMKEYIRRATPLFQPMDTEYNGALCDDTFDELLHMGMFGSPLDMPPALRGQEVHFSFRNPLVQAEEEQKTNSFKELSQLLGVAMQIDPTMPAEVNFRQSFRDAVPGTGAPVKWLNDPAAAAKIRTQAAQQQQDQQEAAQLGEAAETGGKIGAAAQNIAGAATALRQAQVG